LRDLLVRNIAEQMVEIAEYQTAHG